eukprot:gene23038-biopygen8393
MKSRHKEGVRDWSQADIAQDRTFRSQLDSGREHPPRIISHQEHTDARAAYMTSSMINCTVKCSRELELKLPILCDVGDRQIRCQLDSGLELLGHPHDDVPEADAMECGELGKFDALDYARPAISQ